MSFMNEPGRDGWARPRFAVVGTLLAPLQAKGRLLAELERRHQGPRGSLPFQAPLMNRCSHRHPEQLSAKLRDRGTINLRRGLHPLRRALAPVSLVAPNAEVLGVSLREQRAGLRVEPVPLAGPAAGGLAQDATHSLGFWKDANGKWWRLVIKATVDRSETYLVSFGRCPDYRVRSARRRFGTIG